MKSSKDTDLITRGELKDALLKLTRELTIDLTAQSKGTVNQTLNGFAARLYKDLPKIITRTIVQGLNLASIDSAPVSEALEQTLSAELMAFRQSKLERQR